MNETAGSFPELAPEFAVSACSRTTNNPAGWTTVTSSPTRGRGSWQVSKKDKISVYHDQQNKFRPEWGLAANIPPEASGNEVTPTNFVTVEKWTRTQSNKLLFDAGFAIYDQEYTELYQSSVTGDTSNSYNPASIAAARIYTLFDNSTGQYAEAWNNPADHFSKLLTESGSASYVTGSHSFKFGAAVSEGRWRQLQQQDIGNASRSCIRRRHRRSSVTLLSLPTDRQNGIKADTGILRPGRAGRFSDMTLNRRSALRLVHWRNTARVVAGECVGAGHHLPSLSHRPEQPGRYGCTGARRELEGHQSPRRSVL